jgi:EpsI family protein
MNGGRAKAVVAALVMCLASGLAVVAKPTAKVADRGPRIVLETLFPASFGDWRLDVSQPVILPSPDTQELLDRLYNQTLARTYVNGLGERVMLSVAYGGDQSDNMAVHRPEVCYPAQGFEVLKSMDTALRLGDRTVPVRRLLTRLGGRVEPITYWVTVGDRVPGLSGFGQKLAQLTYGLRGSIPDGMLVRVSSIDRQESTAYALHARFLEELTASIPDGGKDRVLGALASHP